MTKEDLLIELNITRDYDGFIKQLIPKVLKQKNRIMLR